MGNVSRNRYSPDVADAIDRLSREIYSGTLLPGARLVENELMKSYSLTRSKVRQVLRELASFGLVSIIHNRGATVAEMTINRIREMYQIVAILEGAAARLAVSRIDEKDIRQLKSVVAKQYDLREGDGSKWRVLNNRFHRVIILKCGNSELIDSIRIYSQFTNYWFSAFGIPPMEESITVHQQIIDFLAPGKQQEAGRLMEEHIIKGGEYVIRYLESNLPFILRKKE